MEQRKLASAEEHELEAKAENEWSQEQEVQAREQGRSLEEAREHVQSLMIGFDLKRLVL